MSATYKVLNRLVGVKQTGTGKWIGRCPSHEDHSPSLSVRELEDGRVLIYCFAGCGAGDVLAAIGLRMSDLFTQAIQHHLPPVRGGFTSRELVELTSHEANVAALIAHDAQTRILTAAELERLAQAAARLGKAQDLAHGR
jgi:DNA primase